MSKLSPSYVVIIYLRFNYYGRTAQEEIELINDV